MSLTYHLLQTMSQAVCCCDEHGVVQASSPAARTLLQHTSETLHNKSLLELIHADDIDRLEIDRLEDALVSLTRQTAVSPCTLRLLNGDACAHAYQTVRVRFTGHEEGSGLLEHILLWLEPAPVQAPSQVHDKVIAEVGQTRTAIAPTEPYTSNRNTPVAVCNNDFASTSSGLYVDERPTALCVLDRQWRFVHLNDTAAQLADKILNDLPLDDLPLDDLPLDDLRGQSLWQVFPNIQHNHIGQTLQHAVEAREPVYFETLNDDDNPRLNFAWFGVHVLPVGEQIVLKIEDITERKYQQQQLEAAQDRSEELFEQRNTVLDAISDCVFMVDASYRFTYVNQVGLELFDVTLEDVLGKPLWDVLHLPEGSPFRQIYLDTMTTGNPQRVRALSRHPKLHGHTLDVKTTPFRGGFIAYSRDVTELEALHAELTQTLADKEAILDSITDGVTVLNREGVYLYANERVRRHNPDIIGKAYAELFPEHQVSIFETYYQRAFDSQEVVCFEAQTHRGSWMDVRVYPAGDRITVYATDFSESKRLEQALRDSEAKFRTFFEKSNTPYTLTVHPSAERDYHYRYNQAFADLVKDTAFFEGDLSSVAGMHLAVQAVTHPEDFAEHKRQFAAVSAGKSDHIMLEKRYLKRDGSVIWASLNVAFLRDDAGNITLSIATLHDITQRKHTEQALRDSETKFRAFFHDSTVPHFMIGYTDDTRERVYLETNATFDALFAGTVLAGTPRIMPAAQYNTLSAALSDAYMQDPLSDSPQEKWYRNQDGSTFCCQVSSVTLKDDQGKSMICLSTLQDITERKHVEQALRDSEAKFRNFFEHGGVPYTLAIHQEDLGERSFTYLYNDAFAHLVANTAFFDDFDPHSTHSVKEAMRRATHPDDFASQEAYLEDIIAKQTSGYHLEKRYLNRDGSVIWVDVEAFVWFEQETNRFFVFGTFQDITERKHAQAELEKALADKDLLLKEVHHRTKNNMQLISSMLSIQSRRIADDLAKQALVDSSKRINLLASIHRTMYQTPNSGEIDAGEQLQQVLKGLARGLRDTPVTIHSDIASVLLDVHQAIPLSLVANELLTNVFKHAFPVPAASDTVMVSLQLSADEVSLEIRDNGAGLPPGATAQESLGMVIITTLTDQLGANVVLENQASGGVLARVTFHKHVLPL